VLSPAIIHYTTHPESDDSVFLDRRFDGIDTAETIVPIRYPGPAELRVGIDTYAIIPPPGLAPCRWALPPWPPDTTPAWVYADTNVSPIEPGSSALYVRRLIVVMFSPGASQAQKEAVLVKSGGRLVGGWRVPPPWNSGHYFFRVEETDFMRLAVLAQRLRAMPGVSTAIVNVGGTPN
jgi:hypothetical protein